MFSFDSAVRQNAGAIAQLVSIDAPITSEKMQPLKKYFDGIDISKAKTFLREFEGLIIVRVESVAFGRPGEPSTVVIFGDALMLVATGP